MDKKFYTIEYKSQKQRIKIFENIVKEFCNNSKIPVEYNKNIKGRGLTDGKIIYIRPSHHGWPVSLFDEISTLLHEICHVNEEHYKTDKITTETELEAEKFVQEHYPKFRKDKKFKEKLDNNRHYQNSPITALLVYLFWGVWKAFRKTIL